MNKEFMSLALGYLLLLAALEFAPKGQPGNALGLCERSLFAKNLTPVLFGHFIGDAGPR
jgi:hypothetical protein